MTRRGAASAGRGQGPGQASWAPTPADLDAEIALKCERLDELRAGAKRASAAPDGWCDVALCRGSCAIEGNALTHDEVASVLDAQRTAAGKPLYDQIQVYNEALAR